MKILNFHQFSLNESSSKILTGDEAYKFAIYCWTAFDNSSKSMLMENFSLEDEKFAIDWVNDKIDIDDYNDYRENEKMIINQEVFSLCDKRDDVVDNKIEEVCEKYKVGSSDMYSINKPKIIKRIQDEFPKIEITFTSVNYDYHQFLFWLVYQDFLLYNPKTRSYKSNRDTGIL